MKSFSSIFVLSSALFLYQLSNQFQTSQVELPNRMRANDASDLLKPPAGLDNPDPTDAASSEANELYSKWFSLKQFVLKQSNWVKLKELKVNLI